MDPRLFIVPPLSETQGYSIPVAEPKFIFTDANLLAWEASKSLAGQWLRPGWSSIGETGTIDRDFKSGPDGCVFLAVYSPNSVENDIT
jgi:hypothetical protein